MRIQLVLLPVRLHYDIILFEAELQSPKANG